MTEKKYVYSFGGGDSEGSGSMKDLLGGKGANLAEMASLGLPVPPGFTITTECCVDYFKVGSKLPQGVDAQIETALRKVEKVMGMDERRYLELADERGTINRIAWYDSGGTGAPVLLIHGFAENACTWDSLLELLPEGRRYIRIDVKGFGWSSKNDPEHLTLFDLAACTAAVVRRLDLRDLTLIGHSMGGAISCLLLADPEIEERVEKLVLIDPAGMFTEVPEFIASLALVSPQNPLMRFASEDLMVYLVMSQAYFREDRISQDLIRQYAEAMRLPGARETMIAAAKNFRIPNVPAFQAGLRRLKLPALIVWGAEDRIISPGDAELFNDCLSNSRLVVFPECGHSPQEEMPEETAAAVSEFLLAAPSMRLLPGINRRNLQWNSIRSRK